MKPASPHHHRLKKELGQHFLKDRKVIDSIINSHELIKVQGHANPCHPFDRIVEIGPGMGAITHQLWDYPLILVDKDPELISYWEQEKKRTEKSDREVQIIQADAVSRSWQQALNPQEKIWLISNLPYNASVPITRGLIHLEQIKWMTLMYQKEVGEKFIASGGMCSLHYLFDCYFTMQKIMIVKPGAFHPPPEVDSIVLSFKRRTQPRFALDDAVILDLEKTLRLIFAQPRKKIARLKKVFHTRLQAAPDHYLDQDFWNLRPEDLTTAQLTGLMEILTCHASQTML
jgi:16S rRNA (adenine1518-N6/adenine1519-N6)-dimethyltransferase